MSITPYYMYRPSKTGHVSNSNDIPLETMKKSLNNYNLSVSATPPPPTPPSLESQKKAIARFVGINDWQSAGRVEEAKRRIVECVMKQRQILDLSGLGLSPFSKNMLKHLEFLGTFICDDINRELSTLPDYFLQRDWTILFIYES